MAEPVYKKIEIVGTSTKSFYEAAANAVAKAAETTPNMSWFEVVEERGSIANGKIQQYQVTLRVGARVD
jgi:flavin-binding protein dodecin